MSIVAQSISLEQQFQYFWLLSFVVALLGGLFFTVVILRWLGKLKPRNSNTGRSDSVVMDPWAEAGQRHGRIGDNETKNDETEIDDN